MTVTKQWCYSLKNTRLEAKIAQLVVMHMTSYLEKNFVLSFLQNLSYFHFLELLFLLNRMTLRSLGFPTCQFYFLSSLRFPFSVVLFLTPCMFFLSSLYAIPLSDLTNLMALAVIQVHMALKSVAPATTMLPLL